ncbi:MAG: polyprenyl synthetase family protein [Nitrospirota bacterium]
MTIKDVWGQYGEELHRVELQIQENLKSDVSLIKTVGRHILQSGGKRLRPLLVILSSKLCGYKGESDSLLASIVEFIHTASLLHDDVVDGARFRRGKPVAHSVWGNQTSILVGDYLYSKALNLAVNMKNQRIMDTLSETTMAMSEGEVFQLMKLSDPDISEEDYLNIIKAKTALLMSASCRIGAIISKVNSFLEEAIAGYGFYLGMAFQLADDILDYKADETKLGKSLGKDIEEGKITLPLICLLRNGTQKEIKTIKDIITSEKFNKNALRYIIRLMERYRCLHYSFNMAKGFIEQAKEQISIFDRCDAKDSLFAIADYVISRER